jgi:hypothetical protein
MDLVTFNLKSARLRMLLVQISTRQCMLVNLLRFGHFQYYSRLVLLKHPWVYPGHLKACAEPRLDKALAWNLYF